jgi:putative hydrolase of HD superfamily
MSIDLDHLFDFFELTYSVRRVKRAMWAKDEKAFENNSEHSFQLALVALYIIEHDQLKLQTYKVMAMALVHDLLEVHAGDTPVFGSDDLKLSKAEREAQAIVQLQEEWPELNVLHDLIEEYEKRETPEAKFVYALDKLVPEVNNYLDHGRNWLRQNVSLQNVIHIKDGKVDVDPLIGQYHQALLKEFRKHPEYFSSGD